MYEFIGFERGTGLLLPDRPEGVPNPQDKSRLISSDGVSKYIEDLVKRNMQPEQHVKQLVEQLDLAILHRGT